MANSPTLLVFQSVPVFSYSKPVSMFPMPDEGFHDFLSEEILGATGDFGELGFELGEMQFPPLDLNSLGHDGFDPLA